jgi:hypothetical protein
VDAIRDPDRLVGVVRHHQHWRAGGAQDGDDVVPHLLAQRRIEAREGLVEEHQPGARRERPGERHPLLLAAREHVGIALGMTAHVDLGEQLLGPLPARRGAQGPQAEGDVVEDAQVREQRKVLKHQAHPALLRRQAVARPGEQLAADRDLSALERLEPGDQAQDGGLAAARGPDETVHLPRRQA